MDHASSGPAAAAHLFQFRAGLSIFFPAFNDARSLPALLAKTMEVLRRVATDYEVIVVNDGSTDDTAHVLEQLRCAVYPQLRIVTHESNQGYGSALRSGFAASTKEFVFYTDGDGQYDPAEMEKLLASVTAETGLVNGYKLNRSDSLSREVLGKAYNFAVRSAFGVRLKDVDCDFRLIRRSLLDHLPLRSTGGAICVELAHELERSGADVIELPVSHLPRLHGRSQFFRLRPLAAAFWQLCALYVRLVLAPALSRPSPWSILLAMAAVSLLSLLTYGRSLTLPFIADDYQQIQLGRDYGPVSAWPALMGDALYRCRATSIVFTYWTDRLIGIDPLLFRLSSLWLHILNSLLVLALGFWRPIGWAVASVAACFFAVSQRHSEAVIWYAALPELLVFFFAIAALLCWLGWLRAGNRQIRLAAFGGALVFFGLALLSKESAVAVVPLLLLAVWLHRSELSRSSYWSISPFAAIAAAYFWAAFSARATHLHFNDGTFSLSAPFWSVLAGSMANLLWDWGFAAMALLACLKQARWLSLCRIAGIWMVATLLPYSFLLHMARVPSRHTYFASVGLSLVVAAGLLALRSWSAKRNNPWLVPIAAAVIVVHQSGYVALVKHRQYALRAEPTERLLEIGRQSPGSIFAKCFPYSPWVARYAFQVRSIDAILVTGQDAKLRTAAVDLCNSAAHE